MLTVVVSRDAANDPSFMPGYRGGRFQPIELSSFGSFICRPTPQTI